METGEIALVHPVSLGGVGKTSQQQPGRKKNVTWKTTHTSAVEHMHRARKECQQTRGSLEGTPTAVLIACS